MLGDVTAKFDPILHFDKLSTEDATKIIYNRFLPTLEKKGILLSYYGNHKSNESLRKEHEYFEMKKTKKLFDITNIQKIFLVIRNNLEFKNFLTQWKTNSYNLKHIIEKVD